MNAARRIGRYELLAQIASGGMGSVLLARLGGAGGFERLFAIKVMHPHLMGDPELVRMLLEEARLAAQIHHPNVVPTIDVGRHASFHYVVMDYVDGFPLTRILHAGPFSAEERIRIVCRALLDALSGLSAAHTLRGSDGAALGIVHRDVSPQNIVIGADGVGRLTDFGIAIASARLGRGGDSLKGKPSYLAPEQARGDRIDHRADLWAVGVVLWEALTGRRLFVAETELLTLEQVLSAPIPNPSVYRELPAALENACLRALERDPRQRPATAREMFSELERAAHEAGLVLASHEVADLLAERLGAEIEGRRRARERYRAPISAPLVDVTLADIQALPRLEQEAFQTRSQGPGSLTVPSGRALRTPAATTSEPAPERLRHTRGVLALLGVFALGSLTTLALLHLRILDESRSVAGNGAALATPLRAFLGRGSLAAAAVRGMDARAEETSERTVLREEPSVKARPPERTRAVSPPWATTLSPTPPSAGNDAEPRAASPRKRKKRPPRLAQASSPQAPAGLPGEENPYQF